MTVKNWNVGDVLTAGDMNAWAVPLAAFKTANTTRNTLTASLDPDLQFTLPLANAFYEVRAGIGYNCSTGGILWNFAIPAGTNGIYEVAANLASNSASSSNWNVPLAANSSTTGALLFHGLLATGSTTGTFGLQWASNSGPASLIVNAYSYLVARRVG